MNKKEKSLLLALAIGDGHISARKSKKYNYTQYSIRFTHSIKQLGYLHYKANLVNSILGGKQNEVHLKDNNGYEGCYYDKSDKSLRLIRNKLYKNNKKCISREILDLLDEQGIAIWFMDDGCTSYMKRNGKIHGIVLQISTCLDTLEELQILIDYFKEKWDINFNVKKDHGKYSLQCATRETRKFMKIVKPYVSKIECMRYKIKE
jgi:hypothetical protein